MKCVRDRNTDLRDKHQAHRWTQGFFALSVGHKKSSIHVLACAVWHPLVRVYFWLPFPRGKVHKGPEDESEDRKQRSKSKHGRTSRCARVWSQGEEAWQNDTRRFPQHITCHRAHRKNGAAWG